MPLAPDELTSLSTGCTHMVWLLTPSDDAPAGTAVYAHDERVAVESRAATGVLDEPEPVFVVVVVVGLVVVEVVMAPGIGVVGEVVVVVGVVVEPAGVVVTAGLVGDTATSAVVADAVVVPAVVLEGDELESKRPPPQPNNPALISAAEIGPRIDAIKVFDVFHRDIDMKYQRKSLAPNCCLTTAPQGT